MSLAVVRLFLLPALLASTLLVSSCVQKPAESKNAETQSAAESRPPAPLEEVVLFPVKVEGKYGYIDKEGKIVIQPKFAAASRFAEGLAGVQNDTGKWGFIDGSGSYRIQPAFEAVQFFSEGLAAVMQGEQYGFIDSNGKMVIEPKFAGAKGFKDGFATVVRAEKMANTVVQTSGFIDKQGKYLVELLSDAGGFSEGLAAARWMGQYFSYIDTSGKKVIEPGPGANRHFQRAGEFSEGLAPVALQQTGRWGYINRRGEIVISPKFGMAQSFSEGRAAVVDRSGKWGYIDSSGKMVIQPKFSEAAAFLNGLAQVGLDGTKIGYIDQDGKYVWAPRS